MNGINFMTLLKLPVHYIHKDDDRSTSITGI